MQRAIILLAAGLGLGAASLAGGAAEPPKPGAIAPPAPPSASAPPAPGPGRCTWDKPCRSALNEAFVYTPSGDRRYLTHR
ncbi:hypothetical protein [Roseicella frigidaeris]|uniref:Uncharacterized protein n=1 Tax=Roseicella frigidaeris TaxID=2230885 RepID=A0A327MBP9_9PROT|nr:hypothetical protein [Roseicella frigidaeris]RAI60380.1 hypothetical protein DOO78_04730 [Roseicella frigidaeris]